MRIITADEANAILRVELFPNVTFPEGFLEKLAGKTLEEQMGFFRITKAEELADPSYGEIAEEILANATIPLEDYAGFEGLVTHDGQIVGALLKGWDDVIQSCPPYGGVYTVVGWTEEGKRDKAKDECAYLICI